MKPFTRSVLELFDGKQRYLIPLYQRKYAWRVEPQLKHLWNDILRTTRQLMKGGEQQGPHFMGALVIAKVPTFGRQVTSYEVIDGQQRLTTFQILLAAIRDNAREISSPYAAESEEYLLNTGVMDSPEVERYALWPSLVDRKSFLKIIDPKAAIEDIVQTDLDEDGYVRLATLAHSFFLTSIRNFLEEVEDPTEREFRMEKLFETLRTRLATVSIELESDDDPQTIFETLNSRGVELSQSDLMRNFIFQRATGLGMENGSLKVDRVYEKHWLPLDSSFWQESETRARNPRPRVDWMLNDHLTMKRSKTLSADGLFENYRRWIVSEKPYASLQDELDDLDKTRSVSERLFKQSSFDTVGSFGHFSKAFDVTTSIPLALYLVAEADLTGEELAECFSIIRSFILRRDVCGLTTKNYNRVFVSLINKLRGDNAKASEKMRQLLLEGTEDTNRWPDDEEFKHGWLTRKQYSSGRKARLRYIFSALEDALRTKLSEEIEIKTDLTIEHIMPQKWKKHWSIEYDQSLSDSELELAEIKRERERDIALHQMGNLTLMTQPLNSKSSHLAFADRMPAIKANSSLALNRALDHYTVWDEGTITERGEILFEEARFIWTRPK